MTSPIDAATLDRIKDAVRSRRKDILETLRALVDQSSFSRDRESVNAVGAIVAREMPSSFRHEVVHGGIYGDHHIFTKDNHGFSPVLLVGHIDTLCPENPAFDRLVEKGDKLLGPGVNDMKGGDTVIIWALKVLDALGLLEDFPVQVIFNGDEEQGSPSSDAVFKAMAGKASRALVYECGGPEGTVVTTRKGNVRHRLTIKGKANHFGNLKERKISAVEELAHKILEIEALNRADGSVATNVGRVGGGLAANAVAETAFMEFDCRMWRTPIMDEMLAKIREIAARPALPGATLELERMAGRPPMEPSAEARRMFELIVATGAALGERIVEEKRGGLSDGCWLSHVGIPTIDGLGPIGDRDFTTEEYILKETLFSRVALSAAVLLDLRAE